MTIQIEVSNMLRIEQAKLDLIPGHVTVVTGPNEAGKTSFATLAGAILSRDENPLGAGKGQGSLYLHDQAENGHVSLRLTNPSDENDVVEVAKWDAKSGEMMRYDINARASGLGAVGLVDFCAQMTGPAKTALWESWFLPPVEEMRQAIKRQLQSQMKPEQLEEIMQLIDGGNLKNVVDAYTARRRSSKEKWMGVTGETWGLTKAADWIPSGWSADMDGLTLAALEEELEIAQDELRSQQIDHAVSVSDIQAAKKARLDASEVAKKGKALKVELGVIEKRVVERNAHHDELKQDLADATRELEAHRRSEPNEQQFKECGACGAKLIVRTNESVLPVYQDDELRKAKEIWEIQCKKLQTARDKAKDLLNGFSETYLPLAEKFQTKTNDLNALRGEHAALVKAAAHADSEATEVDHEAIESAEKAVEKAKSRLQLVSLRNEARQHHDDILAYELVVKILGPAGIRATTMKKSMDEFRANLDRVHKVTGWPRVELDNAYNLSIGGRKFLRVCAASARLRANYAIQIALALAKQEPVVILDAVDMLQVEHQQELAKLMKMICRRQEPPAFLVCGTVGHFDPGTAFASSEVPFGGQYHVVDGKLDAVNADGSTGTQMVSEQRLN